jgi:trimethylamine--corrinoid protein Co-methyltransferase
VADDRWLIDVLEKQGPGGHFLSERSTRANTRNGEWYLPGLGVHDSHDAWMAAGRPTVHDEARHRVDELLSTHKPLPLGDDVERELEKLRQRAAKAQ